MKIQKMIYKLRTDAKMSQEGFAELFGVSRQAVQKWENGSTVPDLEHIIKISRYFNLSLDALVLGNDARIAGEMGNKTIKPEYGNLHEWEVYTSDLLTEYQQSIEEGLDIKNYKDLFEAVAKLPKGTIREQFGDILFHIVLNAAQRSDYAYVEPSGLEEIQALQKKPSFAVSSGAPVTEEKIYGAWMGRICGCMLGKTVEGMRTDELIPFLKETRNYPMHRYIYRSDINEEICKKYSFPLELRAYADEIDGMPVDDDTNYVILAQKTIEQCGRDFTPYDMSRVWLESQSKDAYCTAERVAFCNFVKGYAPPESAMYKNPYREWIGAQIRGDYFGYINPGDPETAAEMAWRDASISHTKNGIYGEMFAAAMLAFAAVDDNLEHIIWGGLGQIPHTSRLYEGIVSVLEDFHGGVTEKECFEKIHQRFDEFSAHGWCHTISNAEIVVASLLYGGGDYGKTICMAVQTGFDTDCNGATAGSVLGMARGIQNIPAYWRNPIGDTLHTSIFGIGTVSIKDKVKMTMKHIKEKKE